MINNIFKENKYVLCKHGHAYKSFSDMLDLANWLHDNTTREELIFYDIYKISRLRYYYLKFMNI